MERGQVPRFVVSEATAIKAEHKVALKSRSDAAIAFERELDAIEHDPALADIEIVAREARMARGTTVLRATIDRAGGVDLALCEQIAARINARLESVDAPYTLEVESAGLERPLVRPADYERFRGSRVRIVTSLTVNGGKTHRGTLGGIRGETVMLATESGELPLPIAAIKSAHLEYDPRADLQRNKRERKTHGSNRHDN
jgi:ribosome maturation factor RimP